MISIFPSDSSVRICWLKLVDITHRPLKSCKKYETFVLIVDMEIKMYCIVMIEIQDIQQAEGKSQVQ